ncbi:hypothetical protein [Lacticaseibacillus daqingensis]|uniref:hypothetical protein n=1 Tax=Lacticaseibacillus daqingensis TaxID=2486014 RepID=UPI000F7A29ED|nr:hypothetical protein [Lacticaseibacillus daqingensis]
MRQTFDERQQQLQHRGYTVAFGVLATSLLLASNAELFILHPLFATQALLVGVPLVLVIGGLISYFAAVDAYLTPQLTRTMPMLAGFFGLALIDHGYEMVSDWRQGFSDPVWAHGQLQQGSLDWAVLLVWLALTLTLAIKCTREHYWHRLGITRLHWLMLAGWGGLLVLTLWVRANVATVHTPVRTTVENYVLMILPLVMLHQLDQTHKRWPLVLSWGWFSLMAYLQLFH